MVFPKFDNLYQIVPIWTMIIICMFISEVVMRLFKSIIIWINSSKWMTELITRSACIYCRNALLFLIREYRSRNRSPVEIKLKILKTKKESFLWKLWFWNNPLHAYWAKVWLIGYPRSNFSITAQYTNAQFIETIHSIIKTWNIN